MLEEELNIYDFDLTDPQELDLPLTFVVADFRNLETRNGYSSKTLFIPSTKRNDSLMASSFDITAEGYFDRNAKARFKLQRFNVPILKGYMQLKECTMENGNIKGYEIALYSDNSGLFLNLQNLSLQDIVYPQHTYDIDTIEASWVNNGDDSDYVYPMIDYGYLEARANNDSLPIECWRPSLFSKRILKRMLNSIGYTLQGGFFEKVGFRDLSLLNPKGFGLSQAQIDAISFKVGMTATQTVSSALGTPPADVGPTIIQFDDETPPFFDNGSDFDITTYIYTVDQDWYGDMTVQVTADLIVECSAPSNWYVDVSPVYKIILYKNGAPVVTEERVVTIGTVNLVTTTEQRETNVFNLFYENQTFTNGDVFIVNLTITNSAAVVTTVTPGPALAFRSKMEIDNDSESTYWHNSPSNKILEGTTIQISQFLPAWKQTDFLKWLCQNYDLIIESNEYAKTVTIETRDEYYYDISEAEDWTAKLDVSQKQRIVQIEEGLNKILKFGYVKDENDDLIILFEENTGVDYSNKEVELDNKFLTGEKDVADLPYAATKMGFTFTNTSAEQLFVPRLINNDNIVSDIADGGIGQSFDFQPRMLIYGGLVEGVSGYGLFRNSGGALVNTAYPFAYFIKNISSNVDTSLSFTNYKDIPGTGYTSDRGLYDRLYKETIRQINFGRMFIGYFKLSETDILNLDFRKPKFITINGNKTYFHLNRINDWLAGKDVSTEVELIQIAYGNGDNTE